MARLGLLVEHVVLDHFALRRRIRVEPRQQRQSLEECQVGGPIFVGEARRHAVHGRAPRLGVRLEARERSGVRLERYDSQVPGQPAGEHGKQPDIGARIHDAVAVVYRDAVPEIRLQDEDLVVDVVGLVLVQMGDR